jgi:hypothetical protein
MSVRGNFRSLDQFSKQIKRLPKETAAKAAKIAAPEITRLGHETFDAGEDAYGNTWKPLKDGAPATLHKTGAMEEHLEYEAVGPKLKVKLGVKYARYQIGKRPVFPKRGKLPDEYIAVLQRAAVDVMRVELAKAGAS